MFYISIVLVGGILLLHGLETYFFKQNKFIILTGSANKS